MHVKKWYKKKKKKKSKTYPQFYIKDIQFTELNNHVGWTTEIIYVNKAGHAYIIFVEAVLWRVTQFFYLLCSQFQQKASGWINKTLLLIKGILSTTIVIFSYPKLLSFSVLTFDLHKMKIKHRIIDEYATKRCFFSI